MVERETHISGISDIAALRGIPDRDYGRAWARLTSSCKRLGSHLRLRITLSRATPPASLYFLSITSSLFHQPTSPSIRYSILTQEVGNAPMISRELRVSMDGGDQLPFRGSHCVSP
ncbi:hypothetical protein EVAR_24273_1 [Eumeta japonica]|uniref:Uncharacterized protein n=1 Tax=Eumeta variegata TaxID=151549 RepID=A0A4C1VE46_EUMVA|nr:hypothetical protein EVAR_24273_1 [Eumeta japonica]